MRRLVDLEVAGVDDEPDRRADGQRDAVRHAVRDANELDRERADRDAVARPDGLETRPFEAVLLQLRFDQRERQRRSRRSGPLTCGITCGTPPMWSSWPCVSTSAATPPFLLQVREVRDDPVDAEQFGVRKHDAGIDHDGRLTPRERQHVHAELAKSTKRNDFEHSLNTLRHTAIVAVPGGTFDGRREPPAGSSIRRWARLRIGGGLCRQNASGEPDSSEL